MDASVTVPAQVQDYPLCPAPTAEARRFAIADPNANGRCLNRLPCTDHDIADPMVGMMLHGHLFIERFHPADTLKGRPWWQRVFSPRPRP